jgi:cell filamentation protein
MLADRAGHPVDLEKLDPGTMLNAMIASFDGDETELTTNISKLIG